MKRTVIGTVAALASMAALTIAMIPLRSHLSPATTALVLVVPVVLGVVTGGFVAGALSVAAGFLVWDWYFLPPIHTLWVGASQNWVALGVYVAVMLPVAHVVARMDAARATARRQEKEIRELFQLSDLLVEEKPLDVLLSAIVTALGDVFGSPQVALFLPRNGRLDIAASVGEPLSEQELRRVLPAPPDLGTPRAQSLDADGLLALALAAAGRPVGLLVLSGGTAARHEETGEEGISQSAVYAPDVIVLDLGLPDLDGLEVCKRIRIWSEVPIIVLSADGSEDRKVDALLHGADDYMTKPFGMRELHARVQVALRHRRADATGDDHPAEIDVGALHLDLVHRQATFEGRPLDLTPLELDFLAFLARNAGKVCTRRMILENVWGPGYASELHYLKVYAYRIRRKLHDEQGQFLQSDPSVGYRLAPAD